MIEFSKYNGCGNDFILIDAQSQKFPVEESRLIARLCKRCTGIGADGLILLEPSSKADFKMRIFNADGTEAEMCGNGVRCLVQFIHDLGHSGNKFAIETFERVLSGSWSADGISVEMGSPTDVEWTIDLEGESLSYLNTGVPHAVLFVEDLKQIDILSLGKKIRTHPRFAPKGTNVTFAQVLGSQRIRFSTYERGVESETLACGTGAAAAALAYGHVMGQPSPVDVETREGDLIKIFFDQNLNVTMKGPAQFVYKGQLPLDAASSAYRP